MQVWRQWGEEFRTQALARDWADRISPCRDGIFLPGVPTHLARIMHRIHMDWWRVMFVPTPCVCGETVSFYHILFKCINCTDQVKPLSDKLISLGLPFCASPERGLEPSPCCRQTDLQLSHGSLPVEGGTPRDVRIASPTIRVRPRGWRKRRVTLIDDRARWRKRCVQLPEHR